MSSVWTVVGTVIFGALLVFAACNRRPVDDADHTRFHPPTELHAVSITDGGIAVDPHSTKVTADETGEPEYMCSRCYKVVSQAHVHVIPWFNDSMGEYVTTFRCDDDWLSSLDETRAHFSGLNSSDAAALRRDGLALLDKIRAKQIILSP